MKIIVIKGKCHSGKSLAIRDAMTRLIKDGYEVLYNSKRYLYDDIDDLVRKIETDRYTRKNMLVRFP